MSNLVCFNEFRWYGSNCNYHFSFGDGKNVSNISIRYVDIPRKLQPKNHHFSAACIKLVSILAIAFRSFELAELRVFMYESVFIEVKYMYFIIICKVVCSVVAILVFSG